MSWAASGARGSGAALVAIAVGEPRAQVQSFVQQRSLPWPQLVDERFQLADALGQTRVPATLVLGRDGKIVYRGGAFDEAALAALRAALVDNRRRPASAEPAADGGGGGVTGSTGRPDRAAR
jgi:peroxiredoxin